jgi:hypothetical protein
MTEPVPTTQPAKKKPAKQKRGPTMAMIKFAELVAAGMDKTNAYRQAYPNAKGKPEGQNVKACLLAKHHLVSPLIVELMVKAKDKAAAQIAYGLKEAMEEAHAAYAMAQTKGLPTAMSSAVFLKARLLGLLAEERKNNRTPLSELTDEQLMGQIKDAAKQAGVELAEKMTADVIAAAQRPAPAPMPVPIPNANAKVSGVIKLGP